MPLPRCGRVPHDVCRACPNVNAITFVPIVAKRRIDLCFIIGICRALRRGRRGIGRRLILLCDDGIMRSVRRTAAVAFSAQGAALAIAAAGRFSAFFIFDKFYGDCQQRAEQNRRDNDRR